ncbi:MAG: hypothetical protein ACR2O0_15630 [Rhizobiaceae bacterium]
MRYFLFTGILIALLAFSAGPGAADNYSKIKIVKTELRSAGSILPAAVDEDVSDEDISSETEELTEQAAEDPLEGLFAKLKSESKASSAGRIARQIVAIWTESGSDSIDLLMQWASEAMSKKKYTVAQDLLAHITVLRPEYAEGWNRRATLYFMMDDYGRSLADIEQVLLLEPRHFGALSGLAAILQKTRKHQRALDTWYKVLDLYPANRKAQKTVIELEEKLAGEGI